MSRHADVQAYLEQELRRSRPDYVVYVPKHFDGSTRDGLNEHFLVFEGPDGSLMAVWTQSPMASGLPGGRQVNRIVFSRSDDGGITWEPPTHVAGPRDEGDPTGMASWGFPLVSDSGRIYVIFNQHRGVSGWIPMHTGTMAGTYSDDFGRTWSEPQEIEMPASPYDDPTGLTPPEWIVWQIPMRDLDGNYFVGYTHWLHESRAYFDKMSIPGGWTLIESVVEFMRFENVHENPEPKDLKISYSAWGDKALRAPHWKYPLLSVAQEPSPVRLPDQRLFCVMRSNSGYIWYSLSEDDGRTWCNPRPLLRKDFGKPILQPVGCAPIYQLSDGRYVLLHHNNRGDISGEKEATHGPRRPAYLCLGEYRPGADQPIWFSESKVFMDNDGVGIGNSRQVGIGLYTSFTTRGGNDVLWHPDRKFFLLGKRVTPEVLADLVVPA